MRFSTSQARRRPAASCSETCGGWAGIVVDQQESLRVGRHRHGVPAVARRQGLRLASGAVVEIGDVELPLERRLARRHEPDLAALLVDAAHRGRAPLADHVPVAGGDRSLQHAAVVVEIEVVVAAALRGPEDLLPLGQEVEVVVQLDPGVAALREELARLAAGHREGQHVEALLVARLALHQQAVAFRDTTRRGRGSSPSLRGRTRRRRPTRARGSRASPSRLP